MTTREVEKRLRKDGWYEVRQTGGHRHFKHDDKPGIVTVPVHPGDIRIGTLRDIYQQAGWGKP